MQGYLAAIAFADTMVGRLIDALDKSPNKDNTIVVLWGDHGWHLGEKQHWRKFTLWEEATRAPLIFVAPGVTKPDGVSATGWSTYGHLSDALRPVRRWRRPSTWRGRASGRCWPTPGRPGTVRH